MVSNRSVAWTRLAGVFLGPVILAWGRPGDPFWHGTGRVAGDVASGERLHPAACV